MNAMHTRSILRHFRAADDDTVAAGNAWYGAALLVCEQQASSHGLPLEHTACAMAHLSPRQSWTKNVEALELLVDGSPQPSWMLTRSWQLAVSALGADDPWTTFGRRASKTRSFARAILGDTDAVTVDIWAARVAGVDPAVLSRPVAYNEVADAFRRAGKRVGVCGRDMQAITWVHIRGRAV